MITKKEIVLGSNREVFVHDDEEATFYDGKFDPWFYRHAVDKINAYRILPGNQYIFDHTISLKNPNASLHITFDDDFNPIYWRGVKDPAIKVTTVEEVRAAAAKFLAKEKELTPAEIFL